MKPIQLWLPVLNVSWDTPSFKRDVERAQRKWLGEDRIWLLPEIDEIVRWELREETTTIFECAIPSETFNMITVVNVSKDGAMYPQVGDAIPSSWNGKLPKNLFAMWINSGDPTFISSTKNWIKMTMPYIKKNKLSYVERRVDLSPGPGIPCYLLNEEERQIELTWPPKGSRFVESISPETESKEFFGEFKWENEPTGDKGNIVVNNDGVKAFHTEILWKKPFNEMFPLGGGCVDLLNHWTYLNSCIKSIDENRSNITTQVCRFSSEGWTNLEWQMVWPAYVTGNMRKLLFDIEGTFNIEVNDIKELLQHERYFHIFHEKIPVTRIFGWEGYFWWELNNIVNVENKSINTCNLCGNIIHGKKGKSFCNKEDNLDCYRKRKRFDKRKERKK
ncbi:hypothetical protein ABC255_10775 [Neobacillus sp. 3P2-tot-E-2]|uniref:hypothetical protein n=1 Tax=Neobacillus sp. 3P2-tot-E-2 TaxID=3132212 RepID=UPI0039A12AEF